MRGEEQLEWFHFIVFCVLLCYVLHCAMQM